MINQSPYPTFEGAFTSEGAQFLKNFEKPVIQDQQSFVFILRIFHTHGHHRMKMPLIQQLLALALIP